MSHVLRLLLSGGDRGKFGVASLFGVLVFVFPFAKETQQSMHLKFTRPFERRALGL